MPSKPPVVFDPLRGYRYGGAWFRTETLCVRAGALQRWCRASRRAWYGRAEEGYQADVEAASEAKGDGRRAASRKRGSGRGDAPSKG